MGLYYKEKMLQRILSRFGYEVSMNGTLLKLDPSICKKLLKEGRKLVIFYLRALIGRMSGKCIEQNSLRIAKVVYMELLVLPTYEGQARLDQLLSKMNELGFELFSFYNLFKTDLGQLKQMDAIFVHKSFTREGLIRQQ